PTCPQQKQQTKKTFKPRFKVDHAASPMPENRQPERLAPRATSNRNGGRDHLGILGEIISVHPGEIISVHPGEIIGIRTPPRKDRHVAFSLPEMNGPSDAAKGLSAIVEAVASGDLTPSEASELTKLVEGYVSVLEAVDHEERLRALEGKLGNAG